MCILRMNVVYWTVPWIRGALATPPIPLEIANQPPTRPPPPPYSSRSSKEEKAQPPPGRALAFVQPLRAPGARARALASAPDLRLSGL